MNLSDILKNALSMVGLRWGIRKSSPRKLIEPDFDDKLQFVFLPHSHPSGRQLQRTQDLASADLYQVHSADPNVVIFRGATYTDHDDRCTRSRVGQLKQWLQTAKTADQASDDEWTVQLRRQDFQKYSQQFLLPGDASASRPSESLTADQRESLLRHKNERHTYRLASFQIPAHALGVTHHFPWPDCPYNASLIAQRHLSNLGVFFRPCRQDAIEHRFPPGSVITPRYGFEALGENSAWDTPASLVILADRNPRLMTDQRIQFQPRNAFFVLEVLMVAGRRHLILLQVDLATADFYRSMRMAKLDELIAETRLWLKEKVGLRRQRSAESFHQARLDSLHADIYDPARDPPLTPLNKPPVTKEFVFGGTYAELYEKPSV
ncbi:hypothetical protein Poly51_58200 [Rubripirellula tenax]|uniref:Uncharacterized protein n=1 Tax=Rubripirellula tenax TaxID=2528015 RepID=A0A5C6E888_9BACT|nr:hypothetical protein [Rubripirellula tenax]TWU44754.1 hypothetical protein Poly51_58200 [Rubripirellula tenax]